MKKESVKFHKQSVLHKSAVDAKLAADKKREMNNPLLREDCRKWMRKPCKKWTSSFKQLSILLGKKGHLLIFPIC